MYHLLILEIKQYNYFIGVLYFVYDYEYLSYFQITCGAKVFAEISTYVRQ